MEINKKIIFTILVIVYIVNSYINNPPECLLNWSVAGDVIFGLVVSALLTYIITGVLTYKTDKTDSLPSAILTGGLLTILGMGIYGLLNNALEINLTTQRYNSEQKGEIVVLNLGMTKPQYTRVQVLDIKIAVSRENPSVQLLPSLKPDKKSSDFLSAEINKLTRELDNRNNQLQDNLSSNNSVGIYLVPGDKVSYSLPLFVQPSDVIRFDVAVLCQQVILGIPIRWSRPQWTSSTVSVHNDKSKDDDKDK